MLTELATADARQTGATDLAKPNMSLLLLLLLALVVFSGRRRFAVRCPLLVLIPLLLGPGVLLAIFLLKLGEPFLEVNEEFFPLVEVFVQNLLPD